MSVTCDKEMSIAVDVNYYSYWKCEEVAMPIVDCRAQYNFTILSGAVQSVPGKIGNGFDLLNFTAEGAANGRFNFHNHDFTVRAWVNLGIDGFGDTGSFQILETRLAIWELSIEDGLLPPFRVPVWIVRIGGGPNPDYRIDGPTLPQSTWTRLIAWYKHGVEIGLKINNDTSLTAPAIHGIGSQPNTSLIMCRFGADSPSLLDEVAIWDRVLTEAEMLQDWNGGAGVTCTP